MHGIGGHGGRRVVVAHSQTGLCLLVPLSPTHPLVLVPTKIFAESAAWPRATRSTASVTVGQSYEPTLGAPVSSGARDLTSQSWHGPQMFVMQRQNTLCSRYRTAFIVGYVHILGCDQRRFVVAPEAGPLTPMEAHEHTSVTPIRAGMNLQIFRYASGVPDS